MARTSSLYEHFNLYLTPLTLTFNLPKKNVSNGTSPLQGQQLCQIVLKSMHYCTSYGPDKFGLMHGRTHIHGTKIVTTMSRLPAIGLDNKLCKNNIFVSYRLFILYLRLLPVNMRPHGVLAFISKCV